MNVKLKSLFKILCVASAVVIFCYIEGKYNLVFGMEGHDIRHAEFEVFGIVQGVFFRKNTKEAADRLGVVGWCMNTRDGTVKGVIEGAAEPFKEMQNWLTKIGSPTSQIDKAVFGEVEMLDKFSYPGFEIQRLPRK